MLAGLIVALLPSGPLTAISDSPWELDLLRMGLVVAVSIAGVWPWAMSHDPQTARRLYIWVIPAALGGIYYLISGDAVALFVSFCLLIGGSLDMWMRRAHLASEELRRRLTR